MPFLPPNQQRQSTEGIFRGYSIAALIIILLIIFCLTLFRV